MTREKSDLSRAFSEDGARKTHVGGQALLEGIMMRGKYNWSVAVREPSGAVYTEEHDLASGKEKNGWLYWPLVRGCRALVESLVLGFKALEIATLHAYAEEDEGEEGSSIRTAACSQATSCSGSPARTEVPEGTSGSCGTAREAACEQGPEHEAACEQPTRQESELEFSWRDDFGRPDTVIDALGAQSSLEVVGEAEGDASEPVANSKDAHNIPSAKEPESEFGKKEMAISMVCGLALGIVLFIVAPAFITNLIVGEYDGNTLLWNIVDGVLRVAVFVFYIWLIGRMSEIKRMFGYHGAEHKTIHCYEHGLPLTPENARSFPRLHVRCGTAFLIMVMIIAIFVYTVVPLNALIAAWGVPDGAPKLALVILSRIVLMPVIAGVSYEITVRWAGSHPDNPLVKVVLWPGMQMQYLTTNEPDDGMLECAIAAMKLVLDREEAEAGKAAQAEQTTQAKQAAQTA